MKTLLPSIYKALADRLRGTRFAELHGVKLLSTWVAGQCRADVVEHDGHTIYLDDLDSLRLSVGGTFEIFETELVKEHIRAGDVVVDIGANIGYYTLILARLVGEQGKVFAFEADPSNFALLKKNIEANGYKNVTPIQEAICAAPAELTLHKETFCNTSPAIWKTRHSSATIAVQGTSLDTFFSGYPDFSHKIAFIKMDIEGAEHEGLKGMRKTLAHNPGLTLITELRPVGLQALGSGIEPFLNDLQQLFSQVLEIDEEKHDAMPADLQDLLRRFPPHPRCATNLLCLPR